MKLKIMHKLLLLVSLPIITLVLFSLTHIDTRYSNLIQNEMYISKLHIMEHSSNLLHELQIERGATLSYMHDVNDAYFTPLLKKQKEKTNKAIEQFKLSIQKIDTEHTSVLSKKYITNLQKSFDDLKSIRESVSNSQIGPKHVFKLYTDINKQLLSLFNSFKLASNSEQTSSELTSLYKLLSLQEYAGQERALVAKFSVSETITDKEMQTYHILLSAQADEYAAIHFLLENHKAATTLDIINTRYKHNDFAQAREEILNHEAEKLLLSKIIRTIGFGGMIHDIHKYQANHNEELYDNFLMKRERFETMMKEYLALSDKIDAEYKSAMELVRIFKNVSKEKESELNDTRILKLFNSLEDHHITLDPVKWFKLSTQRINDLHQVENILLGSILQSINTEVKNNQDLLSKQVMITSTTILLLLFGTFFIARKIKYSIIQLQKGIDNFFHFLNTETDTPKTINTDSDDELNDMAQSINLQMKSIEENLEQDKDFIDETTQIVMLMKEGNFSETPYFEPHNTNLKELKNVFKQLTDFIANKIKEQTIELEKLNSSLEDRVHFQTLELEKQIKEITIAMDKAIAAEIAKDEFLANMSHEIRTPLNAILGFVTILQKQIKEEKSLKYLNIIDSSGKSLLTIINDILDFSKIQSGKFVISAHPANILEELSNATLLFSSKAYDKHLSYHVYIDPSIPQKISADMVRIKQIISNLLSNAIKFTPDDGEVFVNASVNDSNLIISVQDTGIGIAEKNITKVFSAFEQADGSTTRKYGGTGLGLSISHKLTQLMQGELTLTSEEGVGSTFTLNVPVEIVDAKSQLFIDKEKLQHSKIAILNPSNSSQTTKNIKRYLEDFGATDILEIDQYEKDIYDLLFFIPDDSYNEEIVDSKKPAIAMLRSNSVKLANLEHIQALYFPATPRSIIQAINDSGIDKIIEYKNEKSQAEKNETQFIGSILVAEDNKTNQMLISLILDDYGLSYKIANNGVEAVEMFKNEKFDLVLMDENMPELNGIGAMQQIKQYEKTQRLVLTPIVALTASVLDTDKKMFLDAGMDGFVGKPIDNHELELELNRFLEKKE